MPIYEYQCAECSFAFEALLSRSDSEPVACAKCGAKSIERKMSAHSVGSSAHSMPECASSCAPSGACNPQGCPYLNN